MKKFFVSCFCLFLILLSLCSCSGNNKERFNVEFSELSQEKYDSGFNYVSKQTLSQSEAESLNLNMDSKSEDYEYSYQKVKATSSYEDLCTFGVNDDIFYPSALIDFNTMNPIDIDRAPITISIGGLGGTSSSTNNSLSCVVEHPQLDTMRDSVKTLVNNNVNGEKIPANMTIDVKEIKSSDEFNLNLGFGLNFKKLNIQEDFELDKMNRTTSLAIVLKQVYFTVDVTRPDSKYGFFGNSVTNDILNKTIKPEIIPTYISSVSYGRIAIFCIKTNLSKSDVENQLSIGWGQMSENPGSSSSKKLSFNLETALTSLVEDSSTEISAFFYGGNVQNAYDSISINSLKDISNSLKTTENVEDIYALPISYKFRHLDGGLAKIQDTNEYIIKDVKYIPKKLANWKQLDALIESNEIRSIKELSIDFLSMYNTPNANREIIIPNNIEKIKLIGTNDILSEVIFNGLSLKISSRNQPLEIVLSNISFKGMNGCPTIYGSYTNKVIINVEGDSSLLGGNNSSCIEVNDLEICGLGSISITGSDGITNNSSNIVDGSTAIICDNLNINVDGNVEVVGGNGSTAKEASKDSSGINGGNGGNAIRCSSVTIDCEKAKIIGGNGGNGGKAGYKTFYWANGSYGLSGGNGGNAGNAIMYLDKLELIKYESITPGKIGNGGNGGDIHWRHDDSNDISYNVGEKGNNGKTRKDTYKYSK